MDRAGSVTGRAVLALVLMVGFYALALAIVAGLLVGAYLGLQLGAAGIKLALGAPIVAFFIAKAIWPRRDVFEPPGPRLERQDAPALFGVIEEVAAETGQEVPREVYLVNEVNAFVTQRGGWMGFGSAPVMGIGLPLLQALNQDEARSVIAHEFGHFVAGDTRLGPWIYTTRGAIGRAVLALQSMDSILKKPFIWYGTLFMRITSAVSRRQEFGADGVSARLVGSDVARSGLTRVHAAALTFDAYWDGECVPVLQSGYRPSIHQGFQRFTSHERIEKRVAESVDEASRHGEADPYDTHPPLAERLRALEALAVPAPGEIATGPALDWLADIDALERRLLAFIAGPDECARLEAIEWDQTTALVYVPAWRRRADELAPLLGEMTAADVTPGAELIELGRAVLGPDAPESFSPAWDEMLTSAAIGALGTGLAVALLDSGWQAHAPLAEPVHFTRDGHRLEPWGDLGRLAAGELGVDAWRARCKELGIATLRLGSASAAAPAAPKKLDFFGVA